MANRQDTEKRTSVILQLRECANYCEYPTFCAKDRDLLAYMADSVQCGFTRNAWAKVGEMLNAEQIPELSWDYIHNRNNW